MEPQAKRKKKQRKLGAIQDLLAGRIPITVKGQRYVGPQGRHSQQTRPRAAVRMAAGGLNTERELHDADREALVKNMSDVASASARNKEQSRQR